MTLLAVAVAGRGLVDPAGPVFSADDEAVVRGSAAFETLPVYGGRAFLLDEHLARLAGSAERLGLSLDLAEARSLAGLVTGAGDCVLRVFVTSETLVATAAELHPDLDERRSRGLAVRTVEVGEPSPLLAGVKATSYALAMVALREAEAVGADDVIFVGGGRVLDATTANVWWRTGDTLSTPELGAGVLPGVTRSVICELAEELGLAVRPGIYPLTALAGAQEAFTTSSIREVMPIVSLDGAPVGDGAPGPVAARLQDALRLRSRP
jgi:branched-subunit amino acid aminotransferase/4-amino-4-deoxychorismate lyase